MILFYGCYPGGPNEAWEFGWGWKLKAKAFMKR